MSLPTTPAHKQYASATKRLLEATIAHFFAENFPMTFGPMIRQQIAQQVVALCETQFPAYTHLRPGQCLWNAVAIDTRADSARLRLVPVILTLVDAQDIARRAAGESHVRIAEDVVARLLEEAYQQGALLSMRDIALLTGRSESTVTQTRQRWETAHGRLLPHPGTLQDMGTCITHKTAIVVKAIYEGRDTRQVAQETKHTQQAVDRYLKDFHRVRTCYRHTPDRAFICQVTGMSAFLVDQYITLIEKYEGSLLTGNLA